MELFKLNLQLFGEGGGDGGDAGAAADAGTNAEAQSVSEVDSRKGRRSNPLADVKYGKSEDSAEAIAQPTEKVSKADISVTTSNAQEKQTAFENLIKGEYKAEFDSRVQSILNKRFGETKAQSEQMSKMQPILDMLASKYGADAKDIDALSKAIQDDDSYYEDEAIRKGLSVKQLKEMKTLERENQSLKEAREQAERQQSNERIFNQWQTGMNELNTKFGLNANFDEEIQNPDFQALLRNGCSVEAAYKAVHFDDMMGGAMFKTAQTVTEKMANGLQAKAQRPTENGVSSRATAVTKTDVNSLTRKDREEIERRVARGERIVF